MKTPSSKELALLCELAYEESTYSAGGTEVLLQRNTLAVRGTTFGSDIIKDLRGVPWYDNRVGWCHKGFLRGAQAIWPVLRERLLHTDALWLTGHSKGAAEATIIAAFMILDREIRNPLGLITFGSPRVGKKKLIRIVNTIPTTIRYVNGDDPVPSHPWRLWGYRHYRGEFLLKGGRNFWDVDDHRMAEYITNL